MSSSEQHPVNENEKQPIDETQEQQVSQPLFEFPPSGPLLNNTSLGGGQREPQAAPLTQVLPDALEIQPEAVHEVDQKGFVYPPPPSYYQNMLVPPQQPALPLPIRPALDSWPPIADGQVGLRPQSQATTQTYQPPFISKPPAKKSNTWVWVVVTILSVAVLASCGLCSWGAYTLFNTAYQQIAGVTDVVNDYYTNLQARNYTAAYHDLAPQGLISGLTQEQFIQQATQRDSQYGPVNSFIPGQPSFSSDPNTGLDLSRFTITLDVRRSHLHYTVLLTVNKIGGNWKITDFDRI